MVKEINLNQETIKLERLDKTKFKILEHSKQKKMQYVFRCHDAQECDQWIYNIQTELEIKQASPKKSGELHAMSQSYIVNASTPKVSVTNKDDQSKSFFKSLSPRKKISTQNINNNRKES